MQLFNSVCLLAYGLLAVAQAKRGDQYNFKFPMYVSDFYRFYSYTGANTNHQFLEQFDVMLRNMTLNSRKVVMDNFKEATDASTFKEVTSSEVLTTDACKAVNNMWVRDFINELLLYKMDYIAQRYNAASQQLLKEPVDNPEFRDVGFDEPLDKMMVYFWAYQLKQAYDELMGNASKIHTEWEKLKVSINTSLTVAD
ncbi:uncharacterized protein BXIN_2876 [Babesia sp. Xinjiang]|uniref:uncharacterized protein n=1 Tax=Babesia sp. Xinjiang TaxID=462227 RepID=UPI000A229A7A|nr:uncharacterized protein BXIN_2876 [Babesia sp. Xinjiang]ORM39600.1 hypothetical protein BXIN_2876 [Babesia sp. Xinjiang]